MTTARAKIVAVGLLLVLVTAGGVVGFVIGKRQIAPVARDVSGAPTNIDRFARRLELTAAQRDAVEKVLNETSASLADVQARGQANILEILDDEQKVRYQTMLERRKERDEKRRKRRGKRSKKKRKHDPAGD